LVKLSANKEKGAGLTWKMTTQAGALVKMMADIECYSTKRMAVETNGELRELVQTKIGPVCISTDEGLAVGQELTL